MEIVLKNITYKNVFKNINIVFKENEVTSIIGKNGSGKTELLNLIYGIVDADKGEVIIDLKEKSNEVKQNEKIFYLMGDYKNQLFNINVFEDIKYGNKRINEERLNELLTLFNLDSKILTKGYSEISSGEKKKILLISCVLSESKIILLDNPTSGLDYKGIQTLIKLLKREKRTGKIIIIAGENSDFLMSVSDRVIAIDNKKIIACDSRFNVFKNAEILKKLHVGIPNIIGFRNRVLALKNIKLEYRDNINDLLKDIYRHAK